MPPDIELDPFPLDPFGVHVLVVAEPVETARGASLDAEHSVIGEVPGRALEAADLLVLREQVEPGVSTPSTRTPRAVNGSAIRPVPIASSSAGPPPASSARKATVCSSSPRHGAVIVGGAFGTKAIHRQVVLYAGSDPTNRQRAATHLPWEASCDNAP